MLTYFMSVILKFEFVFSNSFIETKESAHIRKEFNFHRTGLGHQHGCHFIVVASVTSCEKKILPTSLLKKPVLLLTFRTLPSRCALS